MWHAEKYMLGTPFEEAFRFYGNRHRYTGSIVWPWRLCEDTHKHHEWNDKSLFWVSRLCYCLEGLKSWKTSLDQIMLKTANIQFTFLLKAVLFLEDYFFHWLKTMEVHGLGVRVCWMCVVPWAWTRDRLKTLFTLAVDHVVGDSGTRLHNRNNQWLRKMWNRSVHQASEHNIR